MVLENSLEKQIKCDSAGTSGYHIGDSPDSRTVANALENGITLHHASRRIELNDFEVFDYIITMDERNLIDVKAKATVNDGGNFEVFKMRHFDELGNDLDVPDPYYGGESSFQNVYNILKRSNRQFLSFLIEKHSLSS